MAFYPVLPAIGRFGSGDGVGNALRPRLCYAHGRNGGDRGVFVSDPVKVYHEALRHGEAGVCYGGALYRIYDPDPCGDGSAGMADISVSSMADDSFSAGNVVLCMHFHDRAGAAEIYAEARRE